MLDLAPHVLRILSEFDGHILLEPLNFARSRKRMQK